MPIGFRTKARRYFKRQWKRGKKWALNRYYPGGKLKAKRIAKDVAWLKSIVNVEKKYLQFDYTADWARTTTGGTSGHVIQPLITLSQGTTAGTRNGNRVKMTSLQYSMFVTPQANTTMAHNYEILILMHKGDVPDSSLTTGTGGTLVSNFLDQDNGGFYTSRSLREIEHFNDWIVLRRIRRTLKHDESSTAGTQGHEHKGYVKLGHHLSFEGATTSPIRNQLYFLFLSNTGTTAAGTTTGLNAVCVYRIHYVDN